MTVGLLTIFVEREEEAIVRSVKELAREVVRVYIIYPST